MSKTNVALFQSFQLAQGIHLRNRVIMAPMTTWSSNDDYTVSTQELDYIRHRAQAVGLVITGCTHVQENGIGFSHEFAAYDDRFTDSLAKLAKAAKSGGAPAILQIFHAGNKAVPSLIPHADLVSASELKAPAGPFNDGQLQSRALSHEEILETIRAFGETTRRAIEAGFDGIELHGAHGFLIQNFFSPLFNQRNDQWGGSLEKRMQFPLAVVKEVKRVIQAHAKGPFLLGYRISVEEYDAAGLRIIDSLQLIDHLIDEQIDYLHVSLSNVLNATPVNDPELGVIAKVVAEYVAQRVPVIAAGQIKTPEQAQQALDLGLSSVAIGQALIMNPNWVELAQSGRGDEINLQLDLEQASELSIPHKLQDVIQATAGWFPVKQAESV
ncbi:NADH-dependent flavin oxidoreductase [Acinetobacter sp. Tr-809]|uniref:NADH-dependent flavin oxidoreductase n=1 Tax=Acinetobacter sp. Tr-809 TaxID=2608324 RepID=UPI0014223715|nr:NADH-dependent flavin oxidoreductase [Acinetobacter sp. Tr-809]NIE96923.1 NADH-dependent flavin oxidoreductase [Acinetobacter sp. Tr-809]